MNEKSMRTARAAAFSLMELQAGLMLLILVLAAALAAYYIGVRMFGQTKTELSANEQARTVLGKLREEIHSCNIVQVGKGNPANFIPIKSAAPQIGNALQIFPSTNTNVFLVYYLHGDQTIRKWDSIGKGSQILAQYVTNDSVFSAQDFAGNVLTNNQNNRVIQVLLQFDPDAKASSGGLHSFYEVQTKVTRRKVL